MLALFIANNGGDKMSTVTETVKDLVTPILDEHDFYLYDIEFVKEGKSWYLRVYIDKDGGITLEDCATVSDQLSEALDNVDPDPIPQAYFLEVSSPGAERPLKDEDDYKRAINQYIHVSLYQQINGQKVYEGTLTKLSDKELTLDYLDKTRHRQIVIDRSKVAKARLAIKF
ncbi:hypothetical protein FD32_GL001029 [Limosilactobacillus panis DSM 6035]|jgi:ribosome maturation factor RimP|uniref:Ribosome maturation factor RimP n=2 Tax=Lactobacillaceae TaxID=33958 RepID=A0A0R1XED1_9LACO|nr:hypothetical protein FD32_GL001029 [Limosilactobacillus panis DSM 6035]